MTDRDIALRAFAERGPLENLTVGDIMTKEVRCCQGHATVEDAVKIMTDTQVRRLPVIDQHRHLVGLLTLADAVISITPQVH